MLETGRHLGLQLQINKDVKDGMQPIVGRRVFLVIQITEGEEVDAIDFNQEYLCGAFF